MPIKRRKKDFVFKDKLALSGTRELEMKGSGYLFAAFFSLFNGQAGDRYRRRASRRHGNGQESECSFLYRDHSLLDQLNGNACRQLGGHSLDRVRIRDVVTFPLDQILFSSKRRIEMSMGE